MNMKRMTRIRLQVGIAVLAMGLVGVTAASSQPADGQGRPGGGAADSEERADEWGPGDRLEGFPSDDWT